MSQTANPKENSKKRNPGKWGFILTTTIAIAAIAATITVPEVRCFLRLKSDSCGVQLQEMELTTQTETGEPLPGVKIQYISQGAPEFQYTDYSGFARVNIPSKGDVNIVLTKDGYPTQNFTIDLQNNQSKTRIIRFAPSGTPEITALASGIPAAIASPTPTNTPSAPANQPASSSTTGSSDVSSPTAANAKANFETLVRTKKCPNCYLVGVNLGWTKMDNGDLRGANLRGAQANSTAWNGVDLSSADLRGFSGISLNLQGANLRGANLDGADLSDSNLRGADLSNVDLSNVNLNRADLSGAILPAGFELPQ